MPTHPASGLAAGESGEIAQTAEFRTELAAANRRAVPHDIPFRHSLEFPVASVPLKSGLP
ncbi:hypothetical protein B7755_005680 [Streptomyces sp. NBS 14/10]|uniref:hypothetical protein n=1 Tax=Streptomyces sp. NBS 14/10 TaxID=1945643 RepID=UPI00211B3475|nr:hypothetical protein [Streptomyces sp. NBS 14/10]KAK1186539.1 hypothetical protein B7755_005680 [Streptomyces sp. NBS 14/10]